MPVPALPPRLQELKMARLFRRAAARARRALTVPGVIIAVVVAGVLGSPAIAQAAVGAAGSPASPAQQATAAQPAAPGGICGVPGIGDIGGLLGFCNAGSSGLIGDLNNICQPSIPAPEPAAGGIDSLIRPPVTGANQPATLYDSYGM